MGHAASRLDQLSLVTVQAAHAPSAGLDKLEHNRAPARHDLQPCPMQYGLAGPTLAVAPPAMAFKVQQRPE